MDTSIRGSNTIFIHGAIQIHLACKNTTPSSPPRAFTSVLLQTDRRDFDSELPTQAITSSVLVHSFYRTTSEMPTFISVVFGHKYQTMIRAHLRLCFLHTLTHTLFSWSTRFYTLCITMLHTHCNHKTLFTFYTSIHSHKIYFQHPTTYSLEIYTDNRKTLAKHTVLLSQEFSLTNSCAAILHFIVPTMSLPLHPPLLQHFP